MICRINDKQYKTYNGAAVVKFNAMFRQLAGVTETNDDKRLFKLQRKSCLIFVGGEQNKN